MWYLQNSKFSDDDDDNNNNNNNNNNLFISTALLYNNNNNIYLTANGLSPGGSGYNACTQIWDKDLRNLNWEGYMRSMQ
jgi:hypothetical protein